MKTIILSSIAINLMIGCFTFGKTGAQNAMASPGYWTASDSSPQGLKSYHIFLVGSYPSSINFIGYKLVNQNLTVCLDFNSHYTNPKPVVCHPIKESEISLKNDSVIDAGFFVVSDKFLTYPSGLFMKGLQ